jgi:integrase
MKSESKKPKKLPKYLTKTKIDEMLEQARNDNKRNYLILLTLWRTGIRNQELVNLKKRDIKFEENRIIIHWGKGNKDRLIPLDKTLGDLLSYHTGDMSLDDLVFPLSTAQVRNIVHRYEGNEVMKPHSYRHSFVV